MRVFFRTVRWAFLALCLLHVGSACAGERRGLACQWAIGPALPAGAGLLSAAAPPPSAGCCGGAPASPQPLYLQAPACQQQQVAVQAVQAPAPVQMLLAAPQPPPASYGCCGGGQAASVVYVPQPQPLQQQQVLYAPAPSCASPGVVQAAYAPSPVLGYRLETVRAALASAAPNALTAAYPTSPMSNEELTDNVVRLTQIVEQLAHLSKQHQEEVLKLKAGLRAPAGTLPPPTAKD